MKNIDMSYAPIISDVTIIGGGVSGSSVAAVLAWFTDVQKVTLLEKESVLGDVNSKATNNSQTLHEGNIESNYTLEKAKKVSYKANILKRYLQNCLPKNTDVYAMHHKMLVAIWPEQIHLLTKRYKEFLEIFPNDVFLKWHEIAQYEPKVMEWRNKADMIAAHYSPDGYTIDFGKLSKSFVDYAEQTRKDVVDVFTNAHVKHIEHKNDIYSVYLDDGRVFQSKALMVAAWWYTPLLLKQFHKKQPEVQFQYGDWTTELAVDDFSILSVAGSFFNSKEKVLNGKVYTMQDPDLPFAAVHWDPEVHDSNITRFWPTALGIPKLERYRSNAVGDYMKVFEISRKATDALLFVLKKDNWKAAKYLFKNTLYEVPYFWKWLFTKEVQKIIPTIKNADIEKAEWYGGTRPQILNTTKTSKKWLDFGEAKFQTLDNSAIFTITPSPGATTCLWNAYTDVQTLIKSFDGKYTFNKDWFDEMFIK